MNHFKYNNKFKFFSCYLFNGSVSFYVYGYDAPPPHPNNNNNNLFNDFSSIIFKCENKEKMILFSVFKNKNEYYSYQFPKTANKEYLYTFYKELRGDDGGHLRRILAEPDLHFLNINSCNDLYYEEKETILIFKPLNPIINFQFNEIINNTDIVVPTTHLKNIPSTVNQNNGIIELTTIIINNTTIIEKNDSSEININQPKSSQISPTSFSKNNEEEEEEKTKKEQIKELSLQKANITKEEILENIEQIMNNTVIGETYEYQEEDFTILIYPTDSELLTNKTHIDFIECESVLKSHYNLSNDSIITFFQMEISNKNSRSLINQVEYQVYDEQKRQLDLSLCNNTNIKIFYGIKNNSDLDMSVLNSFMDSGVNVIYIQNIL